MQRVAEHLIHLLRFDSFSAPHEAVLRERAARGGGPEYLLQQGMK